MFTFILPIYVPPPPESFTLDESISWHFIPENAFDPQEDVV